MILSKTYTSNCNYYSILNKNKVPRKTNKSEVLDYIYAMEEDLLIEILDELVNKIKDDREYKRWKGQ